MREMMRKRVVSRVKQIPLTQMGAPHCALVNFMTESISPCILGTIYTRMYMYIYRGKSKGIRSGMPRRKRIVTRCTRERVKLAISTCALILTAVCRFSIAVCVRITLLIPLRATFCWHFRAAEDETFHECASQRIRNAGKFLLSFKEHGVSRVNTFTLPIIMLTATYSYTLTFRVTSDRQHLPIAMPSRVWTFVVRLSFGNDLFEDTASYAASVHAARSDDAEYFRKRARCSCLQLNSIKAL